MKTACMIEKFKKECTLYDYINNDFVMRPHAIYLWKERLFIIFEEMDGGSLYDIVIDF